MSPFFLALRRYSTSSAVVLRPYQESCLQACTDALASGSTRIGVSLPTGSGKTTVFITLLSRIKPPAQHPTAHRSLVIVNSVELAQQTAAQTAKLFPEWSVEIEQGTKYKASGLADMTVATYQTLLRPARLEKFDPAQLKAIVVDEAHHAAAPSYRRILSRFDSAIRSPDDTESTEELPAPSHRIPILGFSATFSRHDGLALGSVFERIVYHRDFLEMIKEQWLCNVRFTAIRANINLTNVTVNSRTGDFNATSLAHVINTPTVNRLVVQTWLDRAANRQSTLIFCVNLAHVRELTAAFRNAGVDARFIHAATPAGERSTLITSFRAREFPILLNCAILTEGADIPNVDCIILAKPTRSQNVFAQMIGRGMRLSPGTGKDDCHIIDFVDSTGRVAGVVSVPTLFGLDPSELIEDETVESLEERGNKEIDLDMGAESSPDSLDDVPEPKSVTYIDYENPFALVHDGSGAPNIHTLSPYAWAGCGGDVYVLECMGKGFIRIEPENDGDAKFKAEYTPATLPIQTAMMLKVSPYQRSRKILSANTLAEAVRGCDTFANTMVLKGPQSAGLLRTAWWRKELATESQKKFFARWEGRGKHAKGKKGEKPKKLEKLEKPEIPIHIIAADGTSMGRDLSRLTKGEAAHMITRLKHGALARYQKKQKSRMRADAAFEREKQRQARTRVVVGDLPS